MSGARASRAHTRRVNCMPSMPSHCYIPLVERYIRINERYHTLLVIEQSHGHVLCMIQEELEGRCAISFA